jgi:hypothetical protein
MSSPFAPVSALTVPGLKAQGYSETQAERMVAMVSGNGASAGSRPAVEHQAPSVTPAPSLAVPFSAPEKGKGAKIRAANSEIREWCGQTGWRDDDGHPVNVSGFVNRQARTAYEVAH